jgi:threonine/homoserine/homoserine lactone efflux protein
VLNPKVALLFLALVPQFLDEAEPVVPQTLRYAAIFLTMGVIWLLSLAEIVARLADVFRSTRLRRRLQAISGVVLLSLGVRVAVER